MSKAYASRTAYHTCKWSSGRRIPRISVGNAAVSVNPAAAQPHLAGTAPHEVISGQANQANPDLWMIHQLVPDMVTICLTLQV